MSTFTPPQERTSWQRLQRLAQTPQPHLRELLGAGADARHARLQWQAAGVALDASHQAVTHEVMDALLELAEESAVLAQAAAQCRGEAVNRTERRAALHPALRASAGDATPWGSDIAQAIQTERERFLAAAERIRQGQWRGHSGQRITDVVNLGIGGSDLGPRMAVEALASHGSTDVRVHFVSNVDAWALQQIVRWLHPERTLFIVQSKTFTTPETLMLAASARRWLSDHGVSAEAQAAHLIAVTASPDVSRQQGYLPEHTFGFWDWVGGRYSVWSAIGLPLAVAIGADHFRAFLAGGRDMDQHFWQAAPAHNLPLWMALLGVWNRNFLGCPTQLQAAYPSRLREFNRFVQQMDMESNGKSTHVDGSRAQIDTGPILWGGLGIDGQHAYFQLLHQGRHRVPVDFIGVHTENTPLPLAQQHHEMVLLNLRAQARALALGRDRTDTRAELLSGGMTPDEVEQLLPHRTFAGNVPSNTLWLPDLSPYSLGALVALYEHKVFCQAAIWGINPFDQWGVELGKTMAKNLQKNL